MSALPKPVEPEPTGYRETPSMILPASVPPELSSAIDAAGRRAEALASSGRALHFDVDAAGDLRVELRDRHGSVVRTLSPTQAIGLMGGLGQV